MNTKETNDLSAELKKFCDEHNYTKEKVFIVMPFILEYLQDNYDITKKQTK